MQSWKNLGFNLHDMINTKQESVLKSIKGGFEGEDMETQYSVLSYWTYLYFYDYKLAIEADELSHNDRNIDHEIQREKNTKRTWLWVY